MAQALGGALDSCFMGILAFLSTSEFPWPLAPTLVSTLKYRLCSAFSSGIQASTGHKSETVPSGRCLFELFISLRTVGLSGHPS